MKNYEATEAAYNNGYKAGTKDVAKAIIQANNRVFWSVAITNIIVLICFIVLAVVFSKWWIVLFSVLFMSYIKKQNAHKYYRICDRCGKHSEYADSYNEALEKAKANGWIHYVDGNKDYCPECQMKL